MTNAVINAACRHWQLSETAITLVGARENHVYRVQAKNGPAALRLHRPGYRNDEQINSELLWMAMLAQNGISVPEPIKGLDGTYLKNFDGVTVSLLSWVDATPHSKMTVSAEKYFDLGRILAKMHTLADAWEMPPGFNRPTWDLVGDQPTWGRFWENPSLSKEQRQFFLEFRNAARRALKELEPLDFGLIHADLVPDNVLSSGNRLYLIDFDDGGFGHRIFDLATIVRRSRSHSEDNEFAEATIAGYSTERRPDREAMALFEAMRACSYVGWNISRMADSEGISRNTRFIAEAQTAAGKYLAG